MSWRVATQGDRPLSNSMGLDYAGPVHPSLMSVHADSVDGVQATEPLRPFVPMQLVTRAERCVSAR